MFGGLTEGRSKRLVSVLRPTCAHTGVEFFRRGNLHINVDQFSSGEEIEKKPAKPRKGSQGVGTGLYVLCRAPPPALGHTYK